MGTDIHAVFQKRGDAGWEDVISCYEQNRHYRLFAWIGGVCNYVSDTATNLPVRRGLPSDFSMEDNDHNGEWMGDHNHNWLSADEILSADLPPIDDPVPRLTHPLKYFVDEVRRLKGLHGEVRIVFGFDS